MRSGKDYLDRARGRAGQYHNFVDDHKRHSFVSQPTAMGFVSQPTAMSADGSAAPVKKSMPYGFTVSSASGAAVQNFQVLGSYQYINNAGFSSDGTTLTIGSLTITSAIPGVTYRELLYQAMNNPFTVGQTYISCASPTSQVLQVLTVTTKDANGSQVIIPIVPLVDPYQFQAGNNISETEYRLDGYTKITIAQVFAGAVVTFYLYPADNVNPARALSGSPTGRQYGNPGVMRNQ